MSSSLGSGSESTYRCFSRQLCRAVSSELSLRRLVARSPTGRSLLLVSGEVLSLLRADTRGALRIVNTGAR